jgi:hypothetical protein
MDAVGGDYYIGFDTDPVLEGHHRRTIVPIEGDALSYRVGGADRPGIRTKLLRWRGLAAP